MGEITVNIYYEGQEVKEFVKEMTERGIVDAIRREKGNLRYEYFLSVDKPNIVLLIDSWENQEALDSHHKSNYMQTIISLREKYHLKMRVERYIKEEKIPEFDAKFIIK